MLAAASRGNVASILFSASDLGVVTVLLKADGGIVSVGLCSRCAGAGGSGRVYFGIHIDECSRVAEDSVEGCTAVLYTLR